MQFLLVLTASIVLAIFHFFFVVVLNREAGLAGASKVEI